MLDSRLADQWFADSTAEDQAQDRAMVTTLHKDVGPRIAKLKAGMETLTPDQATRELHALRGAVSSIGLLACGQHLLRTEKGWLQLTAAARLAALTSAEECFTAGLTELFQRFPHLREPGA